MSEDAEQEYWRREYERLQKEKDEEVAKRDAELAELRQRQHAEVIDRSIVEAAQKFGAVVPEQVAKLVRGTVRVDEHGRPYVVDRHGNRRLDGRGNEMSVEASVREFLDESPHFLNRRGHQQSAERQKPQTDALIIDGYSLDQIKRSPDLMIKYEGEILDLYRQGKVSF